MKRRYDVIKDQGPKDLKSNWFSRCMFTKIVANYKKKCDIDFIGGV